MAALLLALLGSLAGPGAALAHGTAHEREHHHAQHDAAAHHEHHVVDGHQHAPVPPAEAAAVSGQDSGHDHGHATLDAPVRPRAELADSLPFLAPCAIGFHTTHAVGRPPVPHAALARPQPDAVPPPRTRAPPRD